jgi:hypothetical protein
MTASRSNPDAVGGAALPELRSLALPMSTYATTHRGTRHAFADLRDLLAKATPARSGDRLAGVAAATARERVAAQLVLADVPLARFLEEVVVPYEADEVTRLIVDTHDAAAFAPVAGLTVGQFREWLLSYETDAAALSAVAPGLTPEMVAAVSKLCATRWGCPAGSPSGCSRTTRPTTPPASPPACWTACCTAAATP